MFYDEEEFDLDEVVNQFSKAWEKSPMVEAVHFPSAEDENGVKYSFKDALDKYLKEELPRDMTYIIGESPYIDEYKYIYVEILDKRQNSSYFAFKIDT